MEGRELPCGIGGISDAKIKEKPAPLDPAAEDLVRQIRERARNLYLSRQMLCTEAVMVALNQGLGGGLSEERAVAMAAPFCVALGESGCMCGALTGAVMASGLFLGDSQPYRRRQDMRKSARQLHDTFKTTHGATCCRALTRKVRHDKTAHFRHCADLTAEAAEMAARLVLEKRPDLVAKADAEFLTEHQSVIGGVVRKLFRYFGP
jgi:C_GCAxxG_C_C family probable redox protein